MKGLVEKWLQQVEQVMIKSMKSLMGQAIDCYVQDERQSWILSWPGQIVQSADLIRWTANSTRAIRDNSLKNYLQICNDQIADCVKLVQTNLLVRNQITVEALIVISVHCRDILNILIDLNVTQISDFNWISQLRYYLNQEMVTVAIITTEIDYGFEYLGNTGRLVATPLTDRCFRYILSNLFKK